MCSILAYCSPSADDELFQEMLSRTASRGPDASRITKCGGGLIGFNRLSIMGLTPEGMQPFVKGNSAVACNGELYGFRLLKTYLEHMGYAFAGESDCELLLPLYEILGTKMFPLLNAEFALVLYDGEHDEWIAARDPIGIRPLYYGRDVKGVMVFSSEAKGLVGICDEIKPFPPGHFYKEGSFVCYSDPASAGDSVNADLTDTDEICRGIHDRLIEGVKIRLDADAPIGFLLSGGLDSSLVCGIAARELPHPLETFAVGMDVDAIDLKYAREVADYIGSNHHEVIITKDDVLGCLDELIKALGTYDITTIRASGGMHLVSRWIHEKTNIRVLLTGEISDELFGYKYTDFAPDAASFQKEAQKRIREIHMYDVLRADRCISVNSLEARVPFGDLAFVDYVMRIDPAKKINTYGIGKYLLRHAFEEDKLIPHSILMREKAAFSDAVGHSLRDDIMAYAEELYSDEAYEKKRAQYTHARPFTKESLLYREIFEKHYPGQSAMVVDFWMPNKAWPGCDVSDPSARVLSNYGASGE